jgi:hypothetical protein
MVLLQTKFIRITILVLLSLIFHVNGAVTFPYYCTSADRLNQICTTEYTPLCGYFSKTVQCIKYPCAIDVGSVCTGCQNASVEYLTTGQCPKDQITDPAPGPIAGRRTCSADEKKAIGCKQDYIPVCGYFSAVVKCLVPPCSDTFSNRCMACQEPNVEYTIDSNCPNTPVIPTTGLSSKYISISIVLMSLLFIFI